MGQLLDDLRPLGEKMRARLPESLRNDPHVRQESARLLLAALLRTTNDAIAHDRTHPMFVPELNSYGADGKCGLAAARRAHQAHRSVEADDQEFHIAGEGI